MQVEFTLEVGSVVDMPGLPPIRFRLSDPPGTFEVLRAAEWQKVKVADRLADPTTWTAIADTGWEVKLVERPDRPMARNVMLRPAGGVLPSAATG